jgi:hypothetical protein
VRSSLLLVVVLLATACAGRQADPSGEAEVWPSPIAQAHQVEGRYCVDGIPRLPYAEAELDHDRRVDALLELDRVAGVSWPDLEVSTSAGAITLVSIFDEVGISLTVELSDTVPAESLGTEQWPGEPRLRTIVEHFRSYRPDSDQWSMYVLLAPRHDPAQELSLLIDPDRRDAAVVSVPMSPAHPGEVLHALVHELGHMLNLPHAWELCEDTPSAMSYPWRWPHWSWTDPDCYRFDSAARHHILRGPEERVRPGASAYLDFGG